MGIGSLVAVKSELSGPTETAKSRTVRSRYLHTFNLLLVAVSTLNDVHKDDSASAPAPALRIGSDEVSARRYNGVDTILLVIGGKYLYLGELC